MSTWTKQIFRAGLLAGLAGSSVALAQDAPADPGVEVEVEAQRGPTTYAFNSGQSWLYVLVKYDRNATIAGHDHVIRASNFSGTVRWDPSNIAACNVSITLPVNSLTVDPPGARSREGLEGETSDGDKGTIKENFLGQLEAGSNPNITFQSSACEAQGDKVKVTGDLTIHGVSKRVTTSMRITEDGSEFRGRGSFSVQHSDFGMEPFSAFFGAVRNDNGLKIVADLKARPQ